MKALTVVEPFRKLARAFPNSELANSMQETLFGAYSKIVLHKRTH